MEFEQKVIHQWLFIDESLELFNCFHHRCGTAIIMVSLSLFNFSLAFNFFFFFVLFSFSERKITCCPKRGREERTFGKNMKKILRKDERKQIKVQPTNQDLKCEVECLKKKCHKSPLNYRICYRICYTEIFVLMIYFLTSLYVVSRSSHTYNL